MKIVVLDAHTLNPGDLSWDGLRALGECEIHARTPAGQTLARAAGAQVVLTNKTRLGRAELQALPELRYVGVLATGHDVVDVDAATERGIVVTNVPAYGTASVAQATFALLLELTNCVALHDAAARAGRWTESGEFSHAEAPLLELEGRTLGVVGLGRIGQAVARIALAMGMGVMAASSKRTPPGGLDVALVPLRTVLAEADVVSLHCPLTPETQRMIDAAALSRMKRHALLINTARGGLVDEPALVEALRDGRIGGAALDVLSQEPPPADHPLLSAPRCIVTPHVAWATREARGRLLEVAVGNVQAFVDGSPRNVVGG
ncbi:MAG: D-2-hydroxyacid dehydrogenase [Myxococcales bacterium]|jgi:glycerate dehydrogenase